MSDQQKDVLSKVSHQMSVSESAVVRMALSSYFARMISIPGGLLTPEEVDEFGPDLGIRYIQVLRAIVQEQREAVILNANNTTDAG